MESDELHSINMNAIIIGVTGATGKDIVSQLLADEQFDDVHIFLRRSVDIQHDKQGLLRSIRPMPTSQVAHAMIAMAKKAMN